MIRTTLIQLALKITGWKLEINPDVVNDPKQIMVGFPHTSNIDGVVAMAVFQLLNLNYYMLIKKELFRFPFGPALKRLGGIPVDRATSNNIVQLMTEEFAKHDRFTLVVAPEATRGKKGEKRPIKTGFWHIAKATNVPIVLMECNVPTKVGRIFAKIYPSDSMENDFLEMKRLYATLGVELNFERDQSK